MKAISEILFKFLLGFLTTAELMLIFYFMMMPAKPFVYVGF